MASGVTAYTAASRIPLGDQQADARWRTGGSHMPARTTAGEDWPSIVRLSMIRPRIESEALARGDDTGCGGLPVELAHDVGVGTPGAEASDDDHGDRGGGEDQALPPGQFANGAGHRDSSGVAASA
jgi:hypothetical protein